MQRNIITFVLILLSLAATGQQYEKEGSFNNQVQYHQVTANQGFFMTTDGNQALIYNTDYTLHKTVGLPDFTDEIPYHANTLSKNLLNQDDNLEFIVTYQDTIDNRTQFVLMSGNGNKLKQILGDYYRIINVSGNYKIQVNQGGNTVVYNLPGEQLVNAPTPDDNLGAGNSGTSAHVYPNPASRTVNIQYALDKGQTGQAIIYNASGQAVDRHRIGPDFNKIRLDISGYDAGNYYYQVRTDNGIDKGKFVVQ
jgi:hypothetical protein